VLFPVNVVGEQWRLLIRGDINALLLGRGDGYVLFGLLERSGVGQGRFVLDGHISLRRSIQVRKNIDILFLLLRGGGGTLG